MEQRNILYLFLLLQTTIVRGITPQAINEKDILKVSIQHKVQEEIKLGDKIRYSLYVKNTAASDKAQNVNIIISLPPFVRFEVKKENNVTTSIEDDINVVTIKLLESLHGGQQWKLEFSLIISDTNLDPGRHYVVTPITVKYKKSSAQGLYTLKELYNVPITIAGCSKALGMTDGRIKYYQVTASSSYDVSQPTRARYNDEGDAWCSNKNDIDQYIQVSLSHETKLTAISTKGRRTKRSWVIAYNVLYSDDGYTWNVYSENGEPKRFSGNINQNSPVKNWFLYSFKASFIRIRPLECRGTMCLRFELFGCEDTKRRNCINPLGMEDGRIPSEAFKHNLIQDSSKLNDIRLNKITDDFPFGRTTSPDDGEWLQIDLGSRHKVKSLAIQGSFSKRGTSATYVKTFHLRHSNQDMQWKRIMDSNDARKEKLFTEPSDRQKGVSLTIVLIGQDIIARYFRIIPEKYYRTKFFRVELYGCMAEDDFTEREKTPVSLSRRSVLIDKSANQMFACIYRKDRKMSNCHMSIDGLQWKLFHPSIISIISKERNSTLLFGINRAMKILMSENLGDDWFSISNNEFVNQSKYRDLIHTNNIDDILPGNTPMRNFVWAVNEGYEWGVSGQGIHIRKANTSDTNWRLSALWNCCGNE